MTQERDREVIIAMLTKVFGEERVQHYDHWPEHVTLSEMHTCYEEGGSRVRDLDFEFDNDGQLTDIWVD